MDNEETCFCSLLIMLCDTSCHGCMNRDRIQGMEGKKFEEGEG